MAELIIMIGVALANFVFIGLKSFQQRNVAFDNFGLIIPTSCGMALVEVYMIAQIAAMGFSIPLVIAYAVGGGSGSLAATYLHGKYVLKNGRKLA